MHSQSNLGDSILQLNLVVWLTVDSQKYATVRHGHCETDMCISYALA